MVETLTQTPDVIAPERIVRRDDFGPGHAGEFAYQMVVDGVPCATYIDDKETGCGKLPIGTIDVDLQSDYNPFTYCSEEHALLLRDQIMDELAGRDQRIAGIGRNGFERD